MKKKIKKNLFAYILWAIVAVLIVSFEVSFATRIKDNEKINFFISSNNINEKEFYKVIKDNQPSYLRSVSYRNIDYKNESNFLQLLSSYGSADTDIFILPILILDKFEPQYFFYALDQDKTNAVFERTLTYFVGQNDLTYGFKISSPLFDVEEGDYYMFFAKNTLHLGELNNSSLNGDIIYAKLFL